MSLDTETLKQITEAYKIGYAQCAIDCGTLKPYVNETQAKAKYGPRVIEAWVAEGLIQPLQDRHSPTDSGRRSNCMKRYDRLRLEMIAALANRN